jgi:hypothetical protein
VQQGFSGQFFMSTLSVNNSGKVAGGLNFLEGCYHMYDPPTQPFPGTVLATGTEDYFDSGWYFNAGEFRMPVSGLTHMKQEEKVTGELTDSSTTNTDQLLTAVWHFLHLDPNS